MAYFDWGAARWQAVYLGASHAEPRDTELAAAASYCVRRRGATPRGSGRSRVWPPERFHRFGCYLRPEWSFPLVMGLWAGRRCGGRWREWGRILCVLREGSAAAKLRLAWRPHALGSAARVWWLVHQSARFLRLDGALCSGLGFSAWAGRRGLSGGQSYGRQRSAPRPA